MEHAEESNATWMADLPEVMRDRPLSEIAIPGSHDSTTYHADLQGGIACDLHLPKFVRKLVALFGRPGMLYADHLMRTQDKTLRQQLDLGIRYLDIRLCQKKGELWTLHGLYCLRLREILDVIEEFTRVNGKEILFLDFNHFYEMSETDYASMCRMLERLGTKLCPKQNLDDLTLAKMWSNGWRIIVFYNQGVVRLKEDFLWPDTFCPSPWANTMDEAYLFDFLASNLAQRDSSKFYVVQGVLTPNVLWFFLKFWRSIEEARKDVRKPLFKWLRKRTIGPKGVNFVIMDFVDSQYVKSVLELNRAQIQI